MRKKGKRRSAAFFVVSTALSLSSVPAHADYTIRFMHITCIPQARFLDIRFAPIESGAFGAPFSMTAKPPSPAQSERLWEKYGSYRTLNLSYTCRMPNDTKDGDVYKVVARHAPASNAMDGAYPNIRLTIYRDGVPIIKNVLFGWGTASPGSAVTHFDVENGVQGWYGRYSELCFASGVCQQGMTFAEPLTQESADKMEKQLARRN